MLLAEAMQESSFLKRFLRVLEARVLDEQGSKGSQDQLGEELVATSNRLRDLEVAIAWTQHQAQVSDLPLAAYDIRGDLLDKLADAHEGMDRKAADRFRRQAHTDRSLAVKATWFVDLQIPPVGGLDESEEED